MLFHFAPTKIPGVLLIEPRVFTDERGFFMQPYKYSEFAAQGIDQTFVQENHSHSSMGVLRGLHYQKHPHAQGKLVRVTAGEVFDVAVDLRRGSPTFGQWCGAVLSAENKKMLYLPPWCAHGFCVLSEEADFVYKVTAEYAPEYERGVVWNDPELQIVWPIQHPTLSVRDRNWPTLQEADHNFVFHDEELQRSMGA